MKFHIDMKPMKTRVTKIIVVPEGDPIFSEEATHISIEDEAAGEFVKVSQISDLSEKGIIGISPEEWPALRNAIDAMVAACRKEDV